MDNFEDDTAARYLVERISEEMEKHITLIRCSAHTLQLAINDVFAKHYLNLKAVTNIVKAMKQIKYKPFIEMNKINLPPIWSPSRWGGKHKMQELHFNALGTQFPELSK